MALLTEVRILASLLRGLPTRASHADALAGFYGPQARHYDAFRERLLHGRESLVRLLPVEAGDTVVELGGGTGRNLEFFGTRLAQLARVEVVDLCQPLLDVAAVRAAAMPNVHLVAADATTYRPVRPVDCVYFSYALTMMPDWRGAVRNAVAMLRPGGTLGVVDFYVAPRRPAPGRARHGWMTRRLWPKWFAHDGVRLSSAHLPFLLEQFEAVTVRECRAPVPYVPWATVPYYVFVGRKA